MQSYTYLTCKPVQPQPINPHNLRAGAGTIQGNNIIINGLTDVGTNHRVVWKNVPTTISIQGGKTIRISVAD
ncbi:MAG: hypothetical protein WAZ77_05050, partial [Candidatus Nitrosopolaris sp.]